MSRLENGVPRDPDRFARFASASVVALYCACGLPIGGCSEPLRDAAPFYLVSIDVDGPRSPWGKAAGDINGDGFPDLVVGGHEPPPPALWKRVLNALRLYEYAWPTLGELVWYESPTWKKHLISNQYRVRTDIEVADIDGDGLNDVVAVTDQGLVWFRNPDWTPTLIGNQTLHDLEVADLDGDGKLDVVARNQQLFNHSDGDKLYFYRQESPARWTHTEFRVPAGEGLKVADMDGDGRPDVVVNQLWYRNPGSLADPAAWRAVPYCSEWHWPHAYLDVADMNEDGQPDIVMAPSELVGARFRLSWCQAPQPGASEWIEHVIDPDVETAMHSIVAGDFDGDGRIDIAAATMRHAQSTKDVAIYRQTAGTQAWTRTVIDDAGSHSMKALDFDQDGDLDLFGANLWGDDQTVKLWVNATGRRTALGWRRRIIDNDKPWRSVFVYSADLDSDGLKDLVTGGWWYKNPGTAGGLWQRRDIGPGAYNIALVHDFDGDGAQDVLSSTWRDEYDWTLRERLLRKLGGTPWSRPVVSSGQRTTVAAHLKCYAMFPPVSATFSRARFSSPTGKALESFFPGTSPGPGCSNSSFQTIPHVRPGRSAN